MDGKLSAEFLVHPDRASAAALSERHFRGDQRRNRHGSGRVYADGSDHQAVQRICSGQLPAQDRAHGVQFFLFPALLRLYRGRKPGHVHDIQDPPRSAFRGDHGGREHRGHRRAPLVAQKRGHRLLRTQQQPGDRPRTGAGDLHAAGLRRGLPCAFLALHGHIAGGTACRRLHQASSERLQAREERALARPLLPAQGLARSSGDDVFLLQLRRGLHLCGDLRQGGAGHHERNGSILLSVRHRTHSVPAHRREGAEGEQGQLQRLHRLPGLSAGLFDIRRSQDAFRLLCVRLHHRSGQRAHVSGFPEHVREPRRK